MPLVPSFDALAYLRSDVFELFPVKKYRGSNLPSITATDQFASEVFDRFWNSVYEVKFRINRETFNAIVVHFPFGILDNRRRGDRAPPLNNFRQPQYDAACAHSLR